MATSSIKPPIPNKGPISVPEYSPRHPKPPFTSSKPQAPIQAMGEMIHSDSISRYERAEEAIREHFRELLARTMKLHKVNIKA